MLSMKMIYLHGFNSAGSSSTAQKLKKILPDIITPTINYYSPDSANSQIKTLIESLFIEDKDIVLIGTSLGGFWALYFAQQYKLRCIVNNPSIKPWKTLERYIGLNKNFETGEEIIFS